jgi:hypothetical protein
MFAYGLGILPLIRKLKSEFTYVNQPWYADDAGAGGNFRSIRLFFKRLQELGPDFGYFPEPSKSILVVRDHNLDKTKSAFADFEFQITTGCRYLGGFVGEALRSWLEEKVQFWTAAICEITSTSKNFPQSAYSGLQKSLQQEWKLVQRVFKDGRASFTAVEEALSQAFLPSLFDDIFDDGDPRRKLATLPVNLLD